MKKSNLIISILVMLIFASLAIGGTPQTQKGSASLFFPFNGLSTLSYDDTYIGGQYFLMNKVALGMGFGFSSERDKADKDDDPEIDRSFECDAGIYYYPIQKGPVALYIAPQAGMELSSQYLKSVRNCNSRTLWGGLSIGAEWWVIDQISLSYSTWFGLEYTWGRERIIGSATTEPRNTKLGIIGSATDCVYISFYFK
ncbi:MAG: hypothetical protein V1681_06275 [Candidatus Neomarinimicrobiota bacterium]